MKGIKRRRNFLLTFLLTILLWLLWGGLVYFRPPESNWIVLAFFLLLFLSIFLAAALIFANSRRGLFLALFIILALLFCYHQIGNFLNLGLLAMIFVVLEFYFK